MSKMLRKYADAEAAEVLNDEDNETIRKNGKKIPTDERIAQHNFVRPVVVEDKHFKSAD